MQLTYGQRFEGDFVPEELITVPASVTAAKKDFTPRERLLGSVGLGISAGVYALSVAYKHLTLSEDHADLMEGFQEDMRPQLSAYKKAVFEGMADHEFVKSLNRSPDIAHTIEEIKKEPLFKF